MEENKSVFTKSIERRLRILEWVRKMLKIPSFYTYIEVDLDVDLKTITGEDITKKTFLEIQRALEVQENQLLAKLLLVLKKRGFIKFRKEPLQIPGHIVNRVSARIYTADPLPKDRKEYKDVVMEGDKIQMGNLTIQDKLF